MSIETVWKEALSSIEMKVPKQVYDTWFTPIVLDRIEESTAYLAVPNKFFGDWLHQHYGDLLAEAVSFARGGGRMEIAFSVSPRPAGGQGEGDASTGVARATAPSRAKRGVQLNPKYTFNSFVVGAGNQFAHAACMAVAEQPAKAYNPSDDDGSAPGSNSAACPAVTGRRRR
jgi:chromosomal replication initiator protein